MYFQIEDSDNLGTYSGGSCDLQWLGRSTKMNTMDILDADLTIRSYFGALDFTAESEGVLGKTVRQLNEKDESEELVWQADNYTDKTIKYSPFEQIYDEDKGYMSRCSFVSIRTESMMDIRLGVPSNVKTGYKVYADYKATQALAWDDSNIMQITLEQGVFGLSLSVLAIASLASSYLF